MVIKSQKSHSATVAETCEVKDYEVADHEAGNETNMEQWTPRDGLKTIIYIHIIGYIFIYICI